MYEGTVTRISDRGFGFIAIANQPDCFFHCRDLDDSLVFDETLIERRVKLEIISTSKGPRAQAVRAAD